MSPSDIGCERFLKDMLNLDLAFIERSSYSFLQKENDDNKDNRLLGTKETETETKLTNIVMTFNRKFQDFKQEA